MNTSFSETADLIIDLLNKYEIPTGSIDVQQNIINCAVCIDNAYQDGIRLRD